MSTTEPITTNNHTITAVIPTVQAGAQAQLDGGPTGGGPIDIDHLELPPIAQRPRRRGLSILTMILAACLFVGGGFLLGIHLEKGQASTASATSTSATASTFAARFGGLAGAGGTGGFGRAAGGTGATAGSGAAAGGGTAGTVKLIDGNNIYITNTAGQTVKVSTNAQTAISKTVPGTITDITPGQTVVIQGQAGSDGTIAATSVTPRGGGAGGGGTRSTTGG